MARTHERDEEVLGRGDPDTLTAQFMAHIGTRYGVPEETMRAWFLNAYESGVEAAQDRAHWGAGW